MAVKQIYPITEGTLKRMNFVMDSSEDLETLPDCAAGSYAIDPAAGVIYMKNASGEWVEFGGGN